MKTKRNLKAGMRATYSGVPAPILAVVVPLLGLVYILQLLCAGAVSLARLTGYRASQACQKIT